MSLWLLLAVNSITLGGLLFLLSAGFSLIFGLMRIPNLTPGSFFFLSPLLAPHLPRGLFFHPRPLSPPEPHRARLRLLDRRHRGRPRGGRLRRRRRASRP